MHKKFFAIPAISLLLASAAQADYHTYTPYVGLDYGYVHASARRISPTYHAFGANIGTRYNDYFGTEVFYQQSGSENKKISENTKYKSSYRAYGLDIAAYLPLGCYHTVELLATAGIGEYVFNKKLSGDKHHNDTGLGYRFGGGLIYNITDDLSIRILTRYIETDKISDYDHALEYTSGIRYHF